MSKIDGAGDIGDHLVNIVSVKAVAEQPKSPNEPSIISDESTEKQQEADVEEKK